MANVNQNQPRKENPNEKKAPGISRTPASEPAKKEENEKENPREVPDIRTREAKTNQSGDRTQRSDVNESKQWEDEESNSEDVERGRDIPH